MEKEMNIKEWVEDRIKPDEVKKYMTGGKDFIPDDDIREKLASNTETDASRVREILEKSLSIKMLTPDETAILLNVTDPDLLEEMAGTALKVKKKVYDNRIVTFAPLYMGNKCVNNCVYCGFRKGNTTQKRKVLSLDEVRHEVEYLAGNVGHKRLIVVYGEHPETDSDYMVDSIREIYNVNVPARYGSGSIRRVNVNAAPLSIDEFKKVKAVGIGTYQIFQETYDKQIYNRVHPKGTLKGDYLWRLYAMHRAFEAGIDDVGIGVLFGLANWKFEVMALLYHSIELEERFGVGPHTISFPRLEPAVDTPFIGRAENKVSDDEFKKLIVVLRLSVPHTGMILTARENEQLRRDCLELGITQTDASTCIGVGSYAGKDTNKEYEKKAQFKIGDDRSLEEVIREFAERGYITSFCTAGYRCGRTGECIMEMLKDGREGVFCKLNAVLTFTEWINDFASEETIKMVDPVLKSEIKEIKEELPEFFPEFMNKLERVRNGERDLYF